MTQYIAKCHCKGGGGGAFDRFTQNMFYVLLTVLLHLDVILVNDQLDALFFNVFISTPLHVSSSKCSSSGGPTCINTPSGMTHSSE